LNRTKASNQLKLLTLTAVFSALIFIATAYLPRLPFPGGYVHVGDAFLYLTASMLPAPYACAAGAIGAGLADALSGYMIYVPGTAVIKALMALMFSHRQPTILSLRSGLAVIPAGIICAGGYYLYEVILTRSFAGAAATVPFNLLQALASAIIYLAAAFILDRASVKARLLR